MMKTLQNSWIQQVHQILLENLNEPGLTNTRIANMMHISERNFYKRIKKITGLTPNMYIRLVRLQKAKEILETEDIKRVKEVALKVGFSKTSYFSNLFEKAYGIRPIELIK